MAFFKPATWMAGSELCCLALRSKRLFYCTIDNPLFTEFFVRNRN